MAALHRDQKLVAALAGCVYFQSQDTVVGFRGIESGTGDAGDFVALREIEVKLRRLARHHGDVGEHGDAHFGFAD